MTTSTALLADIDRRLHRTLVDALFTTGKLPSPIYLARAAGIDPPDLPARLAALAEGDYLALDADGQVVCLYPFSPVPTPYIVEIDGLRRFAMCSIDALGISAMFNRPVTIQSTCGVCREPIRLKVSPGIITSVLPETTVAAAGRDIDRPACEACCPLTTFACSQKHGVSLAAESQTTSVLPLEEALTCGEEIFGALLAETLPPRRKRINR